MITLLQLRPYMGDVVKPSPNRGTRKARAIKGIVLHATEDAGNEAHTISWLCSPKSHASCHMLVGRAGRVTRLVGDQQRAWHAGISRWRGTNDVNSITLGIEIANRNDGEPFTDAQYRRVAEIVAHYCRQGLSLDDVVSHKQIAAGRKSDPRGWDWDRFRATVKQMLWSRDDLPMLVPARAPRDTMFANANAAAPSFSVKSSKRSPATTPKHILRSRILWLNALMVLASAAVLVSDALDLAHRVGIIVPPEILKWALFGVGLVNIILRLRSTQPLTCTPGVRGGPPTCSAEPRVVPLRTVRTA